MTNVTRPLNATGPLNKTEGVLGPDAVLDVVPEAVPDLALAVVDAGGGISGGNPRPSPMESTSESQYATVSDEDSESTSMGPARGSAFRRGKTRGDRDLCDRCRDISFSVPLSYIPLNLL